MNIKLCSMYIINYSEQFQGQRPLEYNYYI